MWWAAGIELAGGGAQRDGLADADLAGDDAQQRFADAEADARDGLLVAGAIAQLAGRDGLAEGRAGEAEVADPRRARHELLLLAVGASGQVAVGDLARAGGRHARPATRPR